MHRNARNRIWEACLYQCHTGQIVLLIGPLVVAPPDHIVHAGRINAGTEHQLLHDGDGQIQRGQGFELAADGADGGSASGGNYNVVHHFSYPFSVD